MKQENENPESGIMNDMNNNFNINNVRSSYVPNLKKEDSKSEPKIECECCEHILDDGTHAADCYGRILVKQSDKVDNPDMVQCVKDSLEFFLANPELVSAAVKSADDAYDLLLSDDVEDAYEKSCCGALDAAYERA